MVKGDLMFSDEAKKMMKVLESKCPEFPGLVQGGPSNSYRGQSVFSFEPGDITRYKVIIFESSPMCALYNMDPETILVGFGWTNPTFTLVEYTDGPDVISEHFRLNLYNSCVLYKFLHTGGHWKK